MQSLEAQDYDGARLDFGKSSRGQYAIFCSIKHVLDMPKYNQHVKPSRKLPRTVLEYGDTSKRARFGLLRNTNRSDQTSSPGVRVRTQLHVSYWKLSNILSFPTAVIQ